MARGGKWNVKRGNLITPGAPFNENIPIKVKLKKLLKTYSFLPLHSNQNVRSNFFYTFTNFRNKNEKYFYFISVFLSLF